MPLPNETDVLIVGAGPTGLVLAVTLAQQGQRFLLIDRLAEGANTSRAAVVHARTLEVLEELEVTPRLLSQGLPATVFSMRDRDQILLELSFAQIPSRYQFALMIPQNTTEAVLLKRLEELGGDVRRPCTLLDLRATESGIEASVQDSTGAVETVRARYVVGCDGMHSTVRERAGIEFSGSSYEQAFVLADVHMSGNREPNQAALYFAPEGMLLVVPLPGGHYRVVATADQAPAQPDRADIQALFDQRGPRASAFHVDDIIWSSRFHVHHRLASSYRKGCVLLAGDAAHVHSPAGGQGMNTGIQDAVALGHALSAVLAGAAETVLDDYAGARRRVGLGVVALTDRMTRLAIVTGNRRGLRNLLLRTLNRIPSFKRRIAMRMAELDKR